MRGIGAAGKTQREFLERRAAFEPATFQINQSILRPHRAGQAEIDDPRAQPLSLAAGNKRRTKMLSFAGHSRGIIPATAVTFSQRTSFSHAGSVRTRWTSAAVEPICRCLAKRVK